MNAMNMIVRSYNHISNFIGKNYILVEEVGSRFTFGLAQQHYGPGVDSASNRTEYQQSS
jgi:hypothetical protein